MDKKTVLEGVLTQIEKDFGKGSIMRMGEKTQMQVEAIPTGAISLDVALGVGGIPRGRIVEIYGPESSGKTTVALHIVSEVQKRGGIAAYIDAEHAMDPEYAKNIGVDIDNLLISQPDFGEQALDITESLVRSGAVDILVVDSVAALVPRAEFEGNMGDTHVGLQARLMSQALRKLSSAVNKSKTSVIFINQLREKVGISYGNPEVTPGGRALKFYSSIRIDVRRGEWITTGNTNTGVHARAKVVKNKVAPPFKVGEFDIIYGEGISAESALIELAVESDVIQKSGSWYSYNGNRLGQGRDNVRIFLKENKEIYDEIHAAVRELYSLPSADALKFDETVDPDSLVVTTKSKRRK